MGSFNLACVATNMTILEGDRCVAFIVAPIDGKYGRGVPGDSIQSPFYITSYPIRGTYDDYGRIAPDEKDALGDENTDDRLMMFHEWAYDAMLEAVLTKEARHDAWLKEYYSESGLPDYILKSREVVEETLTYLETTTPEERTQPLPPAPSKDSEEYDAWWSKVLMSSRMSMMIRELVHAPEGETPYANFWQDTISKSGDPRKEYAKYKELVDVAYSMRYTFHFQFHPSRYSGQEYNLEEMLTLYEAMGKYLQEQKEVRDKYLKEDSQ